MRTVCITLGFLLGCSGPGEQVPIEHATHLDHDSGFEFVVAAHDDAQAVSIACSSQADELCNAVDDDCDAAIDEGCGATAALLEVGVSWNSASEVQVEIEGPGDAATITDVENSCQEGRIDRLTHAHVPEPTTGTYRVVLRRGSSCGEEDETQTLASVMIRTGSQTHGPFNIALAEEETQAAVIEVTTSSNTAAHSNTAQP